MTSVNKLYVVEFDCYYFDPRSNVKVLGPFTIDVPGSVNAMDFVQTYKSQSHAFEFAVGTFLSRYSGTQIENETVHLVQGDPHKGFTVKALSKNKDDVFTALGKGLKSRLQSHGLVQKTAQQTGHQGLLSAQPDEGVVCIKMLNNCLVAVVFTSGLLRVWSCEKEVVIAQFDLLKTLPDDLEAKRLSLAKFDFVKREMARDDAEIIFNFAVAFAVQTSQATLRWNLCQLDMIIDIEVAALSRPPLNI